MTEGTEILSAAITPKSTTNRIRIRFQGWGGGLLGGTHNVCAAFVNGGADAVAASAQRYSEGNQPYPMFLEHEYVPGSTSTQTITIRVGPAVSTTWSVNGVGGSRYFGGVAKCTLVLEEVSAV